MQVLLLTLAVRACAEVAYCALPWSVRARTPRNALRVNAARYSTHPRAISAVLLLCRKKVFFGLKSLCIHTYLLANLTARRCTECYAIASALALVWVS